MSLMSIGLKDGLFPTMPAQPGGTAPGHGEIFCFEMFVSVYQK